MTKRKQSPDVSSPDTGKKGAEPVKKRKSVPGNFTIENDPEGELEEEELARLFGTPSWKERLRKRIVEYGCPEDKADEVIAEAEDIVWKATSATPIPDDDFEGDDDDDDDDKPRYTEHLYPYFLHAKKVYRLTLRISLRGIRPAIWRKVEVPSNMSLRHLAEFILAVMGWGNEHLHQFIVDRGMYIIPYHSRRDGLDGDDIEEELSVGGVMHFRNSILFEYDFGDSWVHEVRLVGCEEYGDGEPHLLRFKGGKRACPPEDCGGVWGYSSLLESLSRIKAGEADEEDVERAEWYFGEDGLKNFNPEECWYTDFAARSFSRMERRFAIERKATDIVFSRFRKDSVKG